MKIHSKFALIINLFLLLSLANCVTWYTGIPSKQDQLVSKNNSSIAYAIIHADPKFKIGLVHEREAIKNSLIHDFKFKEVYEEESLAILQNSKKMKTDFFMEIRVGNPQSMNTPGSIFMILNGVVHGLTLGFVPLYFHVPRPEFTFNVYKKDTKEKYELVQTKVYNPSENSIAGFLILPFSFLSFWSSDSLDVFHVMTTDSLNKL